jgi:hypothetical protein
MTFDEIDGFLRRDLGLVTDPNERGAGKTYFFKRAVWLPAETTRVVRVLQGVCGDVMAIKLCVSSDNNNSVLVKPPFERDVLRDLVNAELDMMKNPGRFNSPLELDTDASTMRRLA